MIAARPAKRHYNPDTRPLFHLLKEISSRPAAEDIVLEKPAFRLELRRNGIRCAQA